MRSCLSTSSTVLELLAHPCKEIYSQTKQVFDSLVLYNGLQQFTVICREVAMFVVNYMKSGIKSVASKLANKDEKGLKWLFCKDTDCV
jgi:hypothetical protein